MAAICYRLGPRGIEFLLVQTRGGRWIFPKGGVERDLTLAQSAALEAFEEAGVHGRIETLPFTRYFRSRPKPVAATKEKRTGARPAPAKVGAPVIAHLCEVSRVEKPQESNRKPTWFFAEKAKQRLRKDRAPEFAAELARVIDRALSRIQRLHNSTGRASGGMQRDAFRDGLHKVRFESHEDGRSHDDLRKALLARYILRQRDVRSNGRSEVGSSDFSPAVIDDAVQAHFRKVTRFGAAEVRRTVLRLNSGTNSAPETAPTSRRLTLVAEHGRRAWTESKGRRAKK